MLVRSQINGSACHKAERCCCLLHTVLYSTYKCLCWLSRPCSQSFALRSLFNACWAAEHNRRCRASDSLVPLAMGSLSKHYYSLCRSTAEFVTAETAGVGSASEMSSTVKTLAFPLLLLDLPHTTLHEPCKRVCKQFHLESASV